MNRTEITLPEGWEIVSSDDMTERPAVIRRDSKAVASITFAHNAKVYTTETDYYLADRFEWRSLGTPAAGRECEYEDAVKAAVSWVQRWEA